MCITKRIAAGATLGMLAAQPLLAQDVAPETPRGTYLVHGEEDGLAFVAFEPSLAANNVWPLSFFYYVDGTLAGSARMSGAGDCAAGLVRGRLTHSASADGSAANLPEGLAAPVFSFGRDEGAGDGAIVNFVCGDTDSRFAQSSAPVFGTPASVARTYIALRALGIGDRLSRDLAIRDPASNEALIGTAVPENLREQALSIMADAHPD